MRRILILVVTFLVPLLASAQTGDPINRPVKLDELSSMYQKQSDNESNREFKIYEPKGTAQAAVGTRFSRDQKQYQILTARDTEDTYDAVKADTFQRVIYSARELVSKSCVGPDGPEILVAIDYRAAEPASYEAYVAEVNKRRTGERWEFTKVGSP